MKLTFNLHMLLLSLGLLLCRFATIAQVQSQWDKTFGGNNEDYFVAMIPTSDGGYLLAGYSSSGISGEKSEESRGNSDYWLVKMSNNGTKEWNKTFGGNGYDYLISAIPTSDGGYLLTGFSNSDRSGDKSEENRGDEYTLDYWIVKVSSNGTKEWDKTLGGSGDDHLPFVIQTSDGGFLLAGGSASSMSGDKSEESRGSYDYWLVKMSSNGIKEWDKTLGGNRWDRITFVIQTSDGGYLLAGGSASSVSGDKSEESRGNSDYWIVKVSSNGTKEWDKTLGGSGDEYMISAFPTSDGGYLLAGGSASSMGGDKSEENRGSYDYWIVKVSSNGTKEWDKTFGGSERDDLVSVIQTSDGGFLLAGWTESGRTGDKSEENRGSYDYWIVKMSSNGIKEWDKTLGGNRWDRITFVIQTSDGGYLLAGNSASSMSGDKSEENRGQDDYWLVKMSNNGTKQWDKTFGGSSTDYFPSVIPTSDGGYLLVGSSNSGRSGDKSEENRGYVDYWIIKTTPDHVLPTPLQVNFQDKNTKTPQGWLKDYGLAFGEKQVADSSLTFGWKQRNTHTPIDLSVGGSFPGNGRWRPSPADPLLATLMHMQGNDVKSFRGTPAESYWELAVENGEYLVSVSVGDGYRYTYSDPESHSLNVEGIPAITHFVPQGSNGSLTRFKQATMKVTVSDGLLTIDADGGTNTKINYAIIQPLSSSAVIARKDFSSDLNTTTSFIQAYPNPFTSDLTLTGKGLHGKTDITLLDVAGHVLYQWQQQTESDVFSLDLSQLALKPGVYLLRLSTEEGAPQLVKIVKR